jgi:rubrerythrin
MEPLFYIQDSRHTVGNDMLWWRQDGKGYTTDMREAGVFTLEEAQRKHDNRDTDIPWPKAYIDGKTRPAVDVQYVRRDEALAGSGIALTPQQPKKRQEVLKCEACGSFMSAGQLWAGSCPKCGSDNRP